MSSNIQEVAEKVDADTALKYGKWNKTSIKGVKLKPDVEDENFVDINNLTRQYFLLMMNVLESPFLGSFLSHNTYREEVEIKENWNVKLKPEKRWKIETTLYTKPLLTDGAIIYNWSWKNVENDVKKITDPGRLFRPFFERSVFKLLLEDLHLQIAFIHEVILDSLKNSEKDKAKVHQLLKEKFNSEIATIIEQFNIIVGEFLNNEYDSAYEYILNGELKELIDYIHSHENKEHITSTLRS